MNRNLPSFAEAEARNKLSHFTVQGYELNGIVQGGANDGEELENAIRLGVEHYLAFEPLPDAFKQLLQISIPDDYRYTYCMAGLHDKDQIAKLHVTAIDGKGSSIFETNWEHEEVLKNWNQGQAAVVGEITVPLVRFDTWVDHNTFNLEPFDTLQLDTQGNEMEILKGMGQYLQHFKYLCIELSVTPVYKGETPGHEVAAWLKDQGFTLDSPIYEHNDCFFVRSDIKPTSEGVYYGKC
jgi:FkbM family methyltransferase